MVSTIDLDLCKDECISKDEFPCDRDVFELCLILVEENKWSVPKDPYDAITLYKFLREAILNNL